MQCPWFSTFRAVCAPRATPAPYGFVRVPPGQARIFTHYDRPFAPMPSLTTTPRQYIWDNSLDSATPRLASKTPRHTEYPSASAHYRGGYATSSTPYANRRSNVHLCRLTAQWSKWAGLSACASDAMRGGAGALKSFAPGQVTPTRGKSFRKSTRLQMGLVGARHPSFAKAEKGVGPSRRGTDCRWTITRTTAQASHGSMKKRTLRQM